MQQQEFARRRKDLMRMMGRGAIAIVPAAREKIRNRDSHYPFRQDSDFHYLTGFPEPDAVAVLVPGREQAEYILFCRDRDPVMETWNGRRAGPEGATRTYGADDAFPVGDIDEILPHLMENCDRVFYTMGASPEFDKHVISWVNQLKAQNRQGIHPPQEFVALDHLLHDMRLYKSKAEAEAMRAAARVSVSAHERAMRACRPGMNEGELEAEFLHEFRRHGGTAAYNPIVGGGENGCILHYNENNQPLRDGDLVLIDAACELDCYASDITRTFPVNGRYSPEQRAVYDLVLKSQLAAIDKARPGEHWNAPHEEAVKVLTAGLVKLELLKGSVSKLIKDEAYKTFYMHRTGHWLGLDVHDVGDYKVGDEWRELEPGMVLTVEPGLYIAPGTKGVPKRFQGIGVRIEDDVLVTKGAPDVLTGALVKDADEIETVMQRRLL
ncbi:MAG TPA: Xaa-Pro aminopeptidase [Gammaproteobacteria bacterium]|jgi:Xaa-Pro aminopeptidase|nr:Xaa-Pro aminopeptidase [Gammaproteobacteria bacterium]